MCRSDNPAALHRDFQVQDKHQTFALQSYVSTQGVCFVSLGFSMYTFFFDVVFSLGFVADETIRVSDVYLYAVYETPFSLGFIMYTLFF